MSRGFSRVILVGNLGRDPEMRYSQNGTPITTFSMAVSRRRRDQEGQYQDETSWFRVTLFRMLAENANEWLHKGSRVLVEGQLQIRQYTDANGVERTSVDVTADNFMNLTPRDEAMGEGAGSYSGGYNRDNRGPAGGAPQGGGRQPQQQGQQSQQKNPFDDYDDDIDDVPF
ncbi:MAG TPA: single-stranded DNA-binding protein [Thermomicrobiales bacterium]|nr:single-stranded DNA-binding protein [Thermomicrobiales bacterium]